MGNYPPSFTREGNCPPSFNKEGQPQGRKTLLYVLGNLLLFLCSFRLEKLANKSGIVGRECMAYLDRKPSA